MSLSAIVFLFISSLTHTGWNILSKNYKSTSKTLGLAMLFYFIISFPVFYFLRDDLYIIKYFWFPVIFSGMFNALEFFALFVSFRGQDLSFIYPYKNAWTVLLSAILGVFLGKALEVMYLAYIGFGLIIAGCLLMPVQNIKFIQIKNFVSKPILFCILSAIGTCVYSNIDGYIMNTLKDVAPDMSLFRISLVYVPFMALSTSVWIVPFVFAERVALNIPKEKENYKVVVLMGLFINLGYILICMAYSLARNVNYVVAFRQIGIVLTLVLSFLFLKEKPYLNKIIGSALILSGVVLTALF